MTNQGLFIVLEGSDGAGKTTQFNLLKERLKAVGYDVAVFDFPRYDKQSSYFVKQYLNGNYGAAADISPYTASLFYALDRYEASADIKKALAAGKIVLSNRYAGSNMAHQGSKFSDQVEQRGFFVWADNLEFQLLGIPRPDVNFFLRVPAETSYRLIAKKSARSYTKDARDEHEQDIKHLRRSVATYDLLCQLFPKDFKAVECTKDGKLLSVADINNILWKRLLPLLPSKKPHASHSVVVTLGLNTEPAQQTGVLPDELEHNFKDVSLLLRLHLERLPHQAIDPQFDYWADKGRQFYTPNGLPREMLAQYKSINEQFGQLHSQLAEKLARYAQSHLASGASADFSISELLLPLTPLSALNAVTIRIKKNDIATAASSLLASDTAEEQWAAKQLYLAARQKWPNDFDQPLESHNGPIALHNIIAKLTDERLPHLSAADEQIKLLEARPRLEFDLLAESIYPYSSLSLDEIAEEVSNWPYAQKYSSLKEATSQPEILKKVKYKLDVLSDHLVLNKVLTVSHLKDVQVQAFTPRYGYDVPPIIELAAVDDLYDGYFDLSLKLYSLLQGSGSDDSAPYATLLGHKIRWQLNANAADLQKVMKDTGLKESTIVKLISEKISEVHPLLWEVISNGENKPPLPQANGKSRVKPLHQRHRKGNRGGHPKKS